MEKIEFKYLESKNGLPIAEVLTDGQPILLHSKYDPIKEAERLTDSFKDKIEHADHILLYGAGMGYFVRVIFERYPNKLISVYEPFEEVAELCIKHKEKSKFPLEYIENYVVETTKKTMDECLSVFGTAMQHKFEIIVLPSYERCHQEHLKTFIKSFQKQVETKKVNAIATSDFSRRWTLNALKNLPKTFEHPNFLVEKKKYFKGKPVLLVSAGPSLSEEIKNIKKIKESGLAYIFAVGSANVALVLEGILPDAVCTYDPQSHNHLVFKELYERGIDTIPMIYGTTVGFETLEYYSGPKLYFPTSQDHLTANFHKDKQIVVNDAMTIAIITLQLLTELEVSKIILVGQNFAFKKDLFYANGIKRYDKEQKGVTDNSIQEEDLIQALEVNDVYGNQVRTNSSFKQMKDNMEAYLKLITIPVINTTTGGATIEGTTFQPLQQLIQEELTDKVVMEKWWESGVLESTKLINQQFLKKYRKAFVKFVQQDNELLNHLDDFRNTLNKLHVSQIQRELIKLDELFSKYHQNIFYLATILPIVQLEFEKLKAETQLLPTMDSPSEKTEKLIQLYSAYLASCRGIYRNIAPIVSNWTIPKLAELQNMKNYNAMDGVFQYEGDWIKKMSQPKEQIPPKLTVEEKQAWYKRKKLEDKIELPISFVETSKCGSKIHFRFKGTQFSLFSNNASSGTLRLRVTVDQKITNLVINGILDDDKYNLLIRNEIFACSNLKDQMHDISIEVLSINSQFIFQGIEVNKNGRAFHIHEVNHIEDLIIGKRIRCHYEATYNTVGEFSGLGKDTANFLPVGATSEPDGDFYFIMVDEMDGEKKLIADRNVQHSISFKILMDELINNDAIYNINKSKIRLVNVNRSNTEKDEWLKYIANCKFNDRNDEHVWNHERLADHNIGCYSFVTFEQQFSGVYAKYTDNHTNIWKEHLYAEVPSNSPNSIYSFRPFLELDK